jgi:5,10-methylenetetrahydromethanopterin reductase
MASRARSPGSQTQASRRCRSLWPPPGHVIEVGARHAERVDFTVGAEPDRVRWAVNAAREAEGCETVSLGAFVNVAVHPDRAVARDLVRGSTAILARFATEGGRHGQSSAPAARRLEDEFIDRFAVCGPADEVVERLTALGDLGIERVIVVSASLDADPAAVEESNQRFAEDVLHPLD